MPEVAVKKETARTPAPAGFWDVSPFSLMRRFSEELDRFFENGPFTKAAALPFETEGWMPAIEVTQKNGTMMVKAELPGMKKEEIKVEAVPGGLVIEGERKHEAEEKREGYFRSERSYGKFYRSIPLPEGAEIEKAKAEYVNGVLEVSVPVPAAKKEERRQIPVETKAA
ncbi:MAG: Hsp20/alpha crystallin family protein [Bryobacteraceae bacterium]|nr:Hsp20/alpha crystallin family protein [Bryobacteraceae bacterium]